MAHSTRSTRSRKENKLGVNFESGEKEISILPDVENEREEVISILPDKEEVFKKVNEKNCHNEDCENVLIKAEPEELDSVLNNEGTSDNEMENDDKVDKREGNQKEGKNMEFTYIEGNENEESDDLTGDESEDPLDVFPFVEIKVEGEPMEEDKDNMAPTDANASTSQDLLCRSKKTCSKNYMLNQCEEQVNNYLHSRKSSSNNYASSKNQIGISESDDSDLLLSHFMVQENKRTNQIFQASGDTTNENINSTIEAYRNTASDNTSEMRTVKKQKLENAGDDERIYKCALCDYSSSFARRFSRHMLKHKNAKAFKCTKCDYASSDSTQIKRHMSVHIKEKSFKCSKCDYAGADSYKLKRHMKLHTEEKPYKCTLCDYCTRESRSLKQHFMLHTGERPFKCNECEYTATSAKILRKHMRVHTGEKPYKCTLCDCSFSHADFRKKHMVTHTGEKPHKCTLCDFSSIYSSALKKHLRLHTGVKPYRCTICDFSTAYQYSLSDHMKTHTGERPYECSICGYSAIQQYALKKHMSVHTGEKPYKCTICDHRAFSSTRIKKHMKVHRNVNTQVGVKL